MRNDNIKNLMKNTFGRSEITYYFSNDIFSASHDNESGSKSPILFLNASISNNTTVVSLENLENRTKALSELATSHRLIHHAMLADFSNFSEYSPVLTGTLLHCVT